MGTSTEKGQELQSSVVRVEQGLFVKNKGLTPLFPSFFHGLRRLILVVLLGLLIPQSIFAEDFQEYTVTPRSQNSMDHVTVSQSFDYDNNIGFMKDVPKGIREAFPMCDEFLDVKWFHQIPDGAKSAGLWFGKVLIDIYDGDLKQRKALMATTSCKGNRCYSSTVHLIDVEQYYDMELEDQIKNTEMVKRWYTLGDEADNSSIGIVVKEPKGEKTHWISKIPIGTVIGSSPISSIIRNHYKENVDGYPTLTISHLTRTVCLVSPSQDQIGVMEPKKPFSSDRLMSSLMKVKYEEITSQFKNEYTNLTQKSPEQDLEYFGWWLDYMKNNFREGRLLDVDGDNVLDLWNRRKIIFFINDHKSFIMPWPNSCEKKYKVFTRMVDKTDFVDVQKCIAEEKKKFKNRLNAELNN